MDRLLRRIGFWPLFALSFATGPAIASDQRHELRYGVVNLVSTVTFVMTVRAAALSGRRAPLGFRALLNGFLRRRWYAAVGLAAVGGGFAQWHYDRPWFTAVYAVTTAVAMLAATRPLPPRGDAQPVAGHVDDDGVAVADLAR